MKIQEKRIKVISSDSMGTRNSCLVKPGEKSPDTIPLIRKLFGRCLHDDIVFWACHCIFWLFEMRIPEFDSQPLPPPLAVEVYNVSILGL
jgi:hypothetical protein